LQGSSQHDRPDHGFKIAQVAWRVGAGGLNVGADHTDRGRERPLLGVKRTFLQLATMSVIDPKWTLAAQNCCSATPNSVPRDLAAESGIKSRATRRTRAALPPGFDARLLTFGLLIAF
jgi:hypothetical protein